MFNLSAEKKESLFPKNWPLGFKGDGDEESDGSGDSLCFDSRLCFSDSAEISLHSLTEFVLEMESLGLKIVEFLFRAIGFENPIGEDRTGFRSLVWISEGCRSTEPAMAGGFYPYIVGLQYQSRNQRCSLLGDSGWVAAAAAADSVMVSIGDVAQVSKNTLSFRYYYSFILVRLLLFIIFYFFTKGVISIIYLRILIINNLF